MAWAKNTFTSGASSVDVWWNMGDTPGSLWGIKKINLEVDGADYDFVFPADEQFRGYYGDTQEENEMLAIWRALDIAERLGWEISEVSYV